MPNVISLALTFMSCTFLMGLLLGWLIWSFGSSKERSLLVKDIEFWKSNLEQARFKQDSDVKELDAAKQEIARLKKRLAAKAA